MTLLPHRPARVSAGRGEPVDQKPDLLEVAAELVVTSQLGSPQMLQRKLRTNWGDTQRLLDDLHGFGVVGPPAGEDEPREVLVGAGELSEVLTRIRTAEVVDAEVEPVPPSATVVSPPGVDLVKRPPVDPEPAVLDAEVVPAPTAARPPVGRRVIHAVGTVRKAQPVKQVAHVAVVVVTHRRTVATSRALTRNVVHIPIGAMVLGRRLWEAKTNSRYERIMRGAEAVGNWERLEEWENRAEHARERRHKRRMDWMEAPLKLLRGATLTLLGFMGALLGLGILLASGYHDTSWIITPLARFIDLVVLVTWAITIAWGPLILALPWLLVAVLWHIGRTAGRTPAWLASTGGRPGEQITPSIVVTAFRDLGIAELAKRISAMDDAGAAMVGPIKIAGCGIEVDVTPPRGATAAAAILARQARLAENLHRFPHEVHLSLPERGQVRIWAADPGALDEPIGSSPLVTDLDLKADYRRGKAPWGENLRGDKIEISLFQRHLLITGQSNQGKTRTMVALALWLALDPNVELRIADLKGINDKTGVSDWEPLRDIATEFIAGPTDDHVVAATEMLEGSVREMNRRLAAGGKWKPMVTIVDEAQKAYMCPRVGPDGRPYGGRKANSRFFMAAREIQNQGRVVDDLFWQGTQDPNNDNLPELVREGAHIRGCLAIGTEAKARMALGEKAVEAGGAPHLLRPGLDKGTLVVAGDGAPVSEPGQASVTVRTYYVDHEAACEIAERAKARRGPKSLGPLDGELIRDLLADVADALGPDVRVRATDMAARLRELAPDYEPYRTLTGEELAELLGDEGVEVKLLGGSLTVRRDRVYRALDEREAEGG